MHTQRKQRQRRFHNNSMDRWLQNESFSRMYMADKLPVSVTIILPTRNEEEARSTVDAIPRDWCDELEIMIVDGNSTDRTREIALEKGVRVHLEQERAMAEHTEQASSLLKETLL